MNILVIDVGTSSTRAVLFSPAGERLFSARRTYTPETRDGGVWVQQPAESFIDAMIQCCREVSASGLEISAAAMTAQRSSVIPVDSGGNALHPAIMWHDKRSASICRQINEKYMERLAVIGGMRALPAHSAPKMLYIKRNMPEIYERAYKLIGIQDYLLRFLTGEFVTDRGLASRSMLMDMETGEWSPELMEIFGVASNKLCTLLPVGSVCGRVTGEAAEKTGLPAGAPVITCGGDQQSAVLGLGAWKPGTSVINIGTGSYSAAVTEKYIPSGSSGVSVLRAAAEGTWLLEASAPSAGDAVKWFCSVFYGEPAAFERFSGDAARAAAGAGGVIASCSINGTGTPGWDSGARAFFAGMSASAGREELARGLMEAIAADAAENTARVEEMSGRAGAILAAGGITGSEIFRQVLCDTLGREVFCADDSEATSLGAWAVAASSLGLFQSPGEARDSIKPEERLYAPSRENHSIYASAAERRRELSKMINGGE